MQVEAARVEYLAEETPKEALVGGEVRSVVGCAEMSRRAQLHVAQPDSSHVIVLRPTILPEAYVLNFAESIDLMLNHKQSNDHESPATFLGLPRELRDLIYLYLVQDTRTPPEDPDHAGQREFISKIYFEACSPRPGLLQLKLCSRQIYSEVSTTLAKHVTSDAGPACLDIMVKGSLIWPTWISLPNTRCLDPIVHIDLRLFEAKGWGSEFSTGAYRALWSLFNLLVSQGPCLIHNRRGLPAPLHVGRLRFEIKLCFPTSADDLFGTYRDVFDRLEKLAFDNVGLGNVETIEACMGSDRRVWRLKQLPTGLTLPSRIE